MPQGYLGINWHTCGVADVAAGTYTWGSGTDGYIMGMLVDKNRAGAIAVSRPLTVEQFDDPIHDLRGMALSIRMDCQSLAGYATCRIEY
jgi:hypothetical protein